MTATPNQAPVRPVNVSVPTASFTWRADGSLLVVPKKPLGPYPARFTAHLEHWALARPGAAPVLERGPDGAWQGPTYPEVLAAARAIGQALLDRGLGPERPVALLCGNGVKHLLLLLGALHVGVPVSPISTAYSRGAGPFGKLRHCMAVLQPGLVVIDGPIHARAVFETVAPGTDVVTLDGSTLEDWPSTPYAELLRTVPTAAVDRATAAVDADTVAKVLFTSGSTGSPKGVITTHGMLSSNQQMILQAFPMMADAPPVLVDWLPWNHTFGGNHNLGLVLANGGTLHVDEGRPAPGAFDATAANLRDVAPTMYFNVPLGYQQLADRLDSDRALRERFFSRLGLLFYAAASLPQPLWDRLDALAVQTIGQRIQWLTGMGSTETAPFCLTSRPDTGAGVVGLPAAGVELKLTPLEGKMEARVRGPNVTPGYWRDPSQTAKLFDDEGYLCLGDALVPADPGNYDLGFRFDGRVAEDFKLLSGTWVSVGPLRLRLLEALSPHVKDVVIAGADRDHLGVLAIPHGPAAAEDAAVRAAVEAALARHAEGAPSSARIARLIWLTAPLSIEAGELTDKGSVNQRGVLRNHAALVDLLYSGHQDVIRVLQG